MTFKGPRLGSNRTADRNPDLLLYVLLEPKAGKRDEEIVTLLQQNGAAWIEILSPGFISAQIPLRLKPTLESMAYVEEQTEKRFR
jgi:hypothetical protein